MWRDLQIISGIFRYLAASLDIWRYLQISGGIFRYLAASAGIFRYLAASAGIFRYLAASASIFRYLAASSDIWRHLQISGGICRYLQASSDIGRYLPHTNTILTGHMEYTESLQAPPGTHEAWPTKPKSVSPWPGLAGLKACRLSAGRPGRLRTLKIIDVEVMIGDEGCAQRSGAA